MSNLTNLPTVHPLIALHQRVDARNAPPTNNVTELPTGVYTFDGGLPITSVILGVLGILLGIVFPIVWNLTR